jgi:hypothetical protein
MQPEFFAQHFVHKPDLVEILLPSPSRGWDLGLKD